MSTSPSSTSSCGCCAVRVLLQLVLVLLHLQSRDAFTTIRAVAALGCHAPCASKISESVAQVVVSPMVAEDLEAEATLKRIYKMCRTPQSHPPDDLWKSALSVVDFSNQQNLNLSLESRTLLANIGSRLKRFDDLVGFLPVIFDTRSLPSQSTLDDVMRLLHESHPEEALAVFDIYSKQDISTLASNQIPTVTTFLHAIAAVSALVKVYPHGKDASLGDKLFPILSKALELDRLTVSMVVNALVLCRQLGGVWQSSMAIYSLAKQAARSGRLKNWEKGDKPTASTLTTVNKLPSIIYGQALVTFARGGAEAQTYLLICEMLEEGVVPSALTLDNVFLELSRVGSYHVMLTIVEQLERYRVKVSALALNALINACDKASAYSKALELISTEKISTDDLDKIGLGVVIKACDKLLRPDLAVYSLLSVGERMLLDVSYYERVFAVLVKSGAGDLATELLLEMEMRQLQQPLEQEQPSREPSELPKSSLKRQLRENMRNMKSSVDTLTSPDGQIEDSIEERDVEDEEVINMIQGIMQATFNRESIKKFSTIKRFSEIEQLIEEHVNDVNTFATGKDKFDQLLKMSTEPLVSSRFYSALISSLSKCGRAGDALRVLKSFIKRGGEATNEMFVSAIYSWRYDRDANSADKVFQYMREYRNNSSPRRLGSAIPLEAYNALLVVYAVSRVPRERQDMLLSQMYTDGVAFDSFTYTALLMGQEDRRSVLSLWKEMIERGHEPTIAAVMESLKAGVMTRNGKAALDLLAYLWEWADSIASGETIPMGKGLPAPDLQMCSLVLLALSRSGEANECVGLLAQMRERGINPSPACYSTTLGALERAAEWRQAVNLLLQMQQRGLRIDAKSVNAVLATCSRASQWELMLKLHDQLPTLSRNAYVPNAQSFTHVINAAMKAGNSDKCLEALKAWMQTAAAPNAIPFVPISQVISSLEVDQRVDEAVWVFESLLSGAVQIATDAGTLVVDLHGYTTPVARAAVRSAVKKALAFSSSSQDSSAVSRVTIITGIGKNVLKPSVLQFLETDEFRMCSTKESLNPGRIVVTLLKR